MLCWKSDLAFGDMLSRTTLSIDVSFRDVKSVSMETITIEDEIKVNGSFSQLENKKH